MGEGVAAVPGRCRLWALGRRLWALGRVRGASWVLVVVCGLWGSVRVRYTSFVRGGLSGGRLLKGGLLGGGLSVGWDVVCGQGGAVLYIRGLTVSWIQWGEEGEALTFIVNLNNKNNNERRPRRRSSLGCHVALGGVAPGNRRLVTWRFLDVLAVVVERVGGQKGGAAIVDGDDEAMVVVSRRCR